MSKFEKFHSKNKFTYFDHLTIICVREKRQAILQNAKTTKYEKTKINDRNAKKNILKKFYEIETFMNLSIDEQKSMKIWKLKKFYQRKFNEKKFDKFKSLIITINYHINYSMQRNDLKKNDETRCDRKKFNRKKKRVNTKNALNQIKIKLNNTIESTFNENDHFVNFVTFLIWHMIQSLIILTYHINLIKFRTFRTRTLNICISRSKDENVCVILKTKFFWKRQKIQILL